MIKTYIKATTVPNKGNDLIDDYKTDNAHTWSSEKIEEITSPVRVTLQKVGVPNADIFFEYSEIIEEARILGKNNIRMIVPEGARPLETWASYPSTIFYYPLGQSWGIRIIGTSTQRFEITFLVL